MNTLALDFPGLSGMPRAGFKPAKPAPITGLRKKVWLLLYTEGGWWTAAEIMRSLQMTASNFRSELGDMERSGHIVRKRGKNVDGENLVRFGVKSDCNIPRGVTPGDIEELLRLAVGKRA